MVITFFHSSVREGHVVIQFSQFTIAFMVGDMLVSQYKLEGAAVFDPPVVSQGELDVPVCVCVTPSTVTTPAADTKGVGSSQLIHVGKKLSTVLGQFIYMKKNCSKCKGFHEPAFGKFCKWHLETLCAVCGQKHRTSHGALCVHNRPPTISKDGKPVVGDVPSRDDPEYLRMLEEQYLLSKEKGKSEDFEILSRRLDALEKRQSPVPLEGQVLSGAELGAYASTGGRPKYNVTPAGAAGGGGGGLGVGVDPQGGQPAGPAAADSVVGPLTEVLEKLTIAVDPASTSKKLQCMVFKPEYYVQHIKKAIRLETG